MGRGSSIEQIGFVEFPPPQPETSPPEVWLRFSEEGSEELRHLMVGEEVQLLTWFLPPEYASMPDDPGEATPEWIKASVAASNRALRVHRVRVIEKEPTRLRVRGLEPQQGMAILEVTSVLERGAGH